MGGVDVLTLVDGGLGNHIWRALETGLRAQACEPETS